MRTFSILWFSKDKPLNLYWKIFLLSLLLGAIIFLPFIFYDRGYFLYYGDFNVQQIPFYRLAHQAIREGNFFWNWNTDLGANFIGSYSFYLLGSPFFWITLLFPNSVVPFLMAPLLILKTACASVTGFAFLKRFTQNPNTAFLGGLLYGFCGFNTYNIFFNHFHEAVIIFPLMLVALEETVINGRRGWFALTVFLAATVNYFFFVGQVVFITLYFVFRCFAKDFTITPKKFFILAIESILGLLLSCFLLVPSVLAILDNPRTDNISTGMNLLMYGNEQRYGLILQSLFFPPDIPARPNFFPDSNAKWSSVSAYLPMFAMTGVIVFLKNAKRHWLRRLLMLCGLMAFVPVLNSLFYAMNSSYYARWFYMPTLMMALATCHALEQEEWDFRFGTRFTVIVIAAFSLIGILPSEIKDKQTQETVIEWFSIPPYPDRFWGYIIIAAVSVLLVRILVFMPRRDGCFHSRLTWATSVIIVVYSFTIIGSGKLNAESNTYELLITEGIHGAENFQLDESQFYRVDEDQAPDNMPMYWGMPTIQCFHSIVPASVMEFYDSMGVTRDVASRPENSYYGVRALTSVKYQFCRIDKEKQPELPGFELIGIQNNYNVYENKYFIPMGFTYDYYVSREDYDQYTEVQRDKLLLKGICLEQEDIERYGYLLEELPDEKYPEFTTEDYLTDCKKLRASAGEQFYYDHNSFTSVIHLDRENLVFYSVPYEDGWSAEVNGEPAEIVKSNIGFMAVLAPAGDNQIVFHYETPGLKTGFLISVLALILLGGYLAVVFRMRKKDPDRYFVSRYAHRFSVPAEHPVKAERAYLHNLLVHSWKSLHESNQKDNAD